jgi:thiol-disulfide isomerase/thioredoxin
MRILLSLAALTLMSPVLAEDKLVGIAAHPEAKPFDAAANSDKAVDAALSNAAAQPGKMVIVIMGANWCHDSRALAGWFATPRFAKMLKSRYELVYVDVGMPQIGQGKNLHIAKRFGIKKIKGTPTVMLLSSAGKLLNRKDAPKWRDAASRQDEAIFRYFSEFTPA